MGVPNSVTLYPNQARPEVDAAAAGEKRWQGYKVERYANLLRSLDDHEFDNILSMLPPNDRWEGLGTGLIDSKGKGMVPSGPTQVAFSDHIRLEAMRRLNRTRQAEGLRPLKIEEMQELHWAAIRAESEGRPLQLNPGDTIQGAVPGRTMQHSWEAEPGPTSNHGRLNMSSDEYANEVYNVIADNQGKDRIVREMGGELQLPIERGTGVYKDQTNPGFQSQSLVSHTNEVGLAPASAHRVDATEAVRQYGLAQEARAYHVMKPAKIKDGKFNKNQVDTVEFTTGAAPTEAQTLGVQKILDASERFDLPDGAGVLHMSRDGTTGVVFTPDGYRVLNLGMKNKEFSNRVNKLTPDLNKVVPSGDVTHGSRLGNYAELDWEGGKATKGLLDVLDNPEFPGALSKADSAGTRKIMGDLHSLYQRLAKQGKLQPNQKLMNALSAWKSGGIGALRELERKGLAPAAVLAIFAGAGEQPSPSDSEL